LLGAIAIGTCGGAIWKTNKELEKLFRRKSTTDN